MSSANKLAAPPTRLPPPKPLTPLPRSSLVAPTVLPSAPGALGLSASKQVKIDKQNIPLPLGAGAWKPPPMPGASMNRQDRLSMIMSSSPMASQVEPANAAKPAAPRRPPPGKPAGPVPGQGARPALDAPGLMAEVPYSPRAAEAHALFDDQV